MMLFHYAFLDENNICHTVYETSEKLTDINERTIEIPDYSKKYLKSKWNPETSEWTYFDPVKFEQVRKEVYLDNIERYLGMHYPDRGDEILQRFFNDNGYEVTYPINLENSSVEILEQIQHYLVNNTPSI